MLPLLLAACGGTPLEMTLAPEDPRDTPEAVAETLRRRVERGGGDIRALTIEGGQVRLDARVPGDVAAFAEGLVRPGRLAFHPVDDVAATARLRDATLPSGVNARQVDTRTVPCGADAAAVRAALAMFPVEGRAWLVEPDGADTCGLLVEPEIAGAGVVEDAQLRLSKDLAVELTLTDAAEAVFGTATEGLVGRRVAAVVDDVVVASPTVVEPIHGGKVMLSFPHGPADTVVHARAITAALAGGALHGPLRVVEPR